jgi:hypothetical protein
VLCVMCIVSWDCTASIAVQNRCLGKSWRFVDTDQICPCTIKIVHEWLHSVRQIKDPCVHLIQWYLCEQQLMSNFMSNFIIDFDRKKPASK